MINNNFIVPDIIRDLVSKMLNTKNTNEKMNYILKIEAIRDICNQALVKAESKKKRA
jgi:hypothetical protein